MNVYFAYGVLIAMAIPWGILGTLIKVLAPSIPDIVSTMKNKAERQKSDLTSADDTRVQELERSLNKQLLLIEQLTVQVEKLERAYRVVAFIAVFALTLGLAALSIIVFR